MAKRQKSWSEKLFGDTSKNLWNPKKWGGDISDKRYEITKVIYAARRLDKAIDGGETRALLDYDSLVTQVESLYNTLELEKLAMDNARRNKEVRALVDANENKKG